MLNKPVPKNSKLRSLGLIAVIVTGAILFPMDYNPVVRASNTQENSREHSETNTIVPSLRVGDYTFGMSKDDVLKSLGEPKSIIHRRKGYDIYFDGICFNIVDDLVNNITVFRPLYKFADGLGVGDTEQQIIDAFGEDFHLKQTEGKDFLSYEDKGLVFEIYKDKRTVMEINVSQIAKPLKPTSKLDFQVEGEDKEFAKILRWVDEETGQKLFGIEDIVRFDWDRQIFELTRRSAMDLLANLKGLGQKFTVADDTAIIYQGTFVSPAASMTFHGPVIVRSLPDEKNIQPPLFKIQDGYHSPSRESEPDLRFSERLKKALEQADVLNEIDVNNPPPPIATIAHGWFGKKEGLRALIEVFPETFRLHRSARVHIHLTGGKDLDENHVFDVNATLISKDSKGKFSTKKIFPSHGTGWKNIHVFEMNPWDARESRASRVKPGGAKLSIEVFTRRVLYERAKTYSEPIDRVKTDAINVWIEPGQPLLPEMADKAMIGFQKAVRDSDWVKALEYCSNKVKSKDKEYDSTEAFFKDVLPIDEITALSEFQILGTGSRNNEVISHSCEIKLKVPNYRWPLNWNLSVLKEDSNWVVEFPTKPLEIWLKHEILKMKAANDGLTFDQEKIRRGFDVSLVPLSEHFVIGQPMLFRIEIKNISNETLGPIDTQSVMVMVNDPMIVKDSKGTIIPYIDTDYQTGMGSEFLESGEMIVLTDNYDVTSQYHIVRPGKYSFPFKGLDHIRLSNIVEIDIMPGELSSLESVVEKLVSILPEGWRLTRHLSDGIWVHLIGKPRRKGRDRGIGLFIYVNPDKSNLRGEFLGQTKWGPVYIQSLNAELLWPDYEQQIRKALDIEKVSFDDMDANTLIEFTLGDQGFRYYKGYPPDICRGAFEYWSDPQKLVRI